MIIHLSGSRADVPANIIQVNEPSNEIIRGIFRIVILAFIKPITPVGNNIPHITRNKTPKFTELYDCSSASLDAVDALPKMILFVSVSMLLNSPAAKMKAVTVVSIAIILSLLTKEYKM